MMQSPKEVLKQIFGYEEFRQGQNAIINSIVNKKNVLAIMPTGAGKSLCYQIPAIINEKKTIVISTLDNEILNKANYIIDIDSKPTPQITKNKIKFNYK